MIEQQSVLSIEERNAVQDFFFEAMLAGYAADAKPAAGILPGSKAFRYEWDDLTLVDEYFVNERSDWSGGSTIIVSKLHGPLWIMFYCGFYQKEAIPCLKAALTKAYKEQEFWGGRGPRNFLHNGFLYFNETKGSDFFGHCFGEESVVSPDRKELGWHKYQSLWLA